MEELDDDLIYPGPDNRTPEEIAAYERWVVAKVAAARADPRPSVPHDVVMAQMRALIASRAPKTT